MADFSRDADLEGHKQQHLARKVGWWATLGLAYSSVGVIYGDIGTSPLYVYSSTFHETPTTVQILGAASLIFWTLTLLVIVKYIVIVLRADDHGEGGTFALYSLICRYANISAGHANTFEASDSQLSAYSSFKDAPLRKLGIYRGNFGVGTRLRKWLQRSSAGQAGVLAVVLIMTSMVLGDGVLTPAQSVLGAIYGLQVKKPDLKQDVIIGVSCAILVLLFLAQRFGTSKVGGTFAPIVLLWFFLNIIVACYNIHKHDRAIFRALSPHYAVRFFTDDPFLAWKRLSGIFLCITGTEAAYADLGHFSRRAIQLSFTCIAYPALVLTYFGQAAWLTANADQVGSTFYASIPWGNGFYWFFFTVASAAACVASQAMISGAFSIIRQSMALGCFPRVSIKHTSKSVEGQIYIPVINYTMMILTVVVVVIFKDTTKLGNAYGIAVSSMMLGTTALIFVVMLMVWEINVFLATAFLVLFGSFDAIYLSSNLEKIPKGGWFALAVAGVVAIASHIWQWGTMTKRRRIAADKARLEDLLFVCPPGNASDESGQGNGVAEAEATEMLDVVSNQPLLRNPGIGLFYSEHAAGAPPVLPIFIHRWRALHKMLVLVTVRHIPVPTIEPEERILFVRLPFPGMYRCVARYGYMDVVDHAEEFVASLLQKAAVEGPLPLNAEELAAAATSAAYVMSRPVVVAQRGNYIRQFVLNTLYGGLAAFSRQAWEDWNIPLAGMAEVAILYDV